MKSKKRKVRPKVLINPVKGSTALRRYRKVLLEALRSNCSTYSWKDYLYSSIRESRWTDLYKWADSVTTDVYDDAAEYFAANQMSALVKKYPWHWKEIGLTQSPESAAIETFQKAEKLCEMSNRRFRTLRCRKTSYRPMLEYMRTWIEQVLGESPNLKSIYRECGFSSGAAIGVHGNATNLYRKLYAENWTVTPCARDYALQAIRSNDQILLSAMESRNGYVCFDYDKAVTHLREKCIEKPFNSVSFVPKTAKTERSIAVEPLLNSFLQKGIDTVLRKKLRKWGYDLSDQTKNQILARKGSIDGSLATVDLSSASDTVSIELVKYLLPWDWFDLLNRSRSASYQLNGKVFRYEKFASMGNGFCFPLETLVFTAAVRACIHFARVADKTHSVYGDDIILPSECYGSLSKLLGYCGFRVNPSKSFEKGPFRESCGADWYLGQDVRPVYLDYHLTDDLRLMIFHNATYRGPMVEQFFETVRPMVREWVPYRTRLCRPRFAQPKVVQYDADDFASAVIDNGAFSVGMDLFMGSSGANWDRSIWNWKWKEVLCTPIQDYPYTRVERESLDKEERENGPKMREYRNSQYLSFLLGSPGGKLNLRRKVRLSFCIK